MGELLRPSCSWAPPCGSHGRGQGAAERCGRRGRHVAERCWRRVRGEAEGTRGRARERPGELAPATGGDHGGCGGVNRRERRRGAPKPYCYRGICPALLCGSRGGRELFSDFRQMDPISISVKIGLTADKSV